MKDGKNQPRKSKMIQGRIDPGPAENISIVSCSACVTSSIVMVTFSPSARAGPDKLLSSSGQKLSEALSV